jgi:hypothetical protein
MSETSEKILMPVEDARMLDAIVHKLGIEDSHDDPCDVIDALIKDRDHWKALAESLSPSHDISGKSAVPSLHKKEYRPLFGLSKPERET